MGDLPGIELSGGEPLTYPWSPDQRGICGVAKEMGHHVISGAAIGACRVIALIGPVCGLSSGYCLKSATADSVSATASIIFPDYRVYQILEMYRYIGIG